MQPLKDSSFLVGTDYASGVLVLYTKDGRAMVYRGVPSWLVGLIHAGIMKDGKRSSGRAYNRLVRKKYEYDRVDGLPTAAEVVAADKRRAEALDAIATADLFAHDVEEIATLAESAIRLELRNYFKSTRLGVEIKVGGGVYIFDTDGAGGFCYLDAAPVELATVSVQIAREIFEELHGVEVEDDAAPWSAYDPPQGVEFRAVSHGGGYVSAAWQ